MYWSGYNLCLGTYVCVFGDPENLNRQCAVIVYIVTHDFHVFVIPQSVPNLPSVQSSIVWV